MRSYSLAYVVRRAAYISASLSLAKTQAGTLTGVYKGASRIDISLI